MPSGAKKRKAAKKKKEVGLTHPPDSPPPTSDPCAHGNGEQQQQQDSGSDDGHMEPEEKHVEVAEVVKEATAEEEVPLLPSAAANVVVEEESKDGGDVSVEFVEEKKEKVDELPLPEVAVAPVVEVESVNQEVAEAVEAQGEHVEVQTDALAAVKSPSQESEAAAPTVESQVEQVEALASVKSASRESEVVAPGFEAQGEHVESQAEGLAEPAFQESAPAVALPKSGGEKPLESGESLPESKSREIAGATTEVGHEPSLPVRRATLWNCCGLLDVFAGSER